MCCSAAAAARQARDCCASFRHAYASNPGARQVPAFPELFAQINRAIAALGGRVLPKLNWSAPLDAAWLTTTGSIACTNAEEVGLRMLVIGQLRHGRERCHGSQVAGLQSTQHGAAWPCLFMICLCRTFPHWACA